MYEKPNDMIKHALLFTCIALLAACSAQVGDTTGSTAKTSSLSNSVSNTGDSKLLASLAATYPNGQLAAALKAQADIALAQNPAVLKMAASSALVANVKASFSSINSSIKPQAITTDTGSYSPVYRIQNNNLPGAYFFTIFDSERYAALSQNPSWKLEGAAFYTATTAAEGLSPVYRFRNKTNGSYVYTIFEEEYQSLLANYSATFVLEGVSWYARQSAAAGYTPLYRFRNKTNGTYLFSAYESEKNIILASYSAIFEFEGVSYYVNTTDTNPECGEKLPEQTLATLPTNYSAKLLDASYSGNITNSNGNAYLTNTGMVAWLGQCSYPPCAAGQTTVKMYNAATDVATQSPVLGDYVNLISLSDAGIALINAGAGLPPYDQNAEISTLPFAKLWDGVTATDSVVRAPNRLNHRAGRFMFSMPMGGVNDGSGRKWAYPNFPSYLDGEKIVNTSATLQLGNFPDAVNHCGTAVSSSHFTRDGLYYSRGTLALNTIGEKLSADATLYPHLGVAGLTDTRTIFGSLDNEFGMTGSGLIGFIKTAAAERYYPNAKVIDVNNANTGIGYTVAPNAMPPISYVPVEGQIMAINGAQALKPKVPSLAAGADGLMPMSINNSGQILAVTCTPASYGGCNVTNNKLYLLTPQ